MMLGQESVGFKSSGKFECAISADVDWHLMTNLGYQHWSGHREFAMNVRSSCRRAECAAGVGTSRHTREPWRVLSTVYYLLVN